MAFNRTTVECKGAVFDKGYSFPKTFNRTTVECKVVTKLVLTSQIHL